MLDDFGVVKIGHFVASEFEFGDTCPAAVNRIVVAVFVGIHAQRGRLDTHRQVLRNHSHVLTLAREVECDCEDATVVVSQLKTNRQRALVDVV